MDYGKFTLGEHVVKQFFEVFLLASLIHFTGITFYVNDLLLTLNGCAENGTDVAWSHSGS